MAITLDGTNGITSPDFEPSSSTTPTNGLFLPTTNALGFATNSTERLRLDASGNLGIGTTSPPSGSRVAISGGALNFTDTSARDILWGTSSYVYITGNQGTGVLAMGTASTERARIDSSGNLLVGTTSANAILTTKALNNNASTFALYCMNSSSTQLFKVRDDGLIETGTATNSPYNYTTGSAANTFVNSSGQFQRSTSSARYKNSIADAVHGLAEVLKLRPVTYKGNNDGDTVFGGLIAEEVHSVGLTEFVQYNDDGEPDALAYGNMVSLAFKAIQELTARLEALENK